ncbi:membrane protein [Actinotalea ferrariae CF5-4]|uniref:Membrane protein n=1 Tax=Actinotalea ferrariae CF5-4 TaxID=948458 RepID=A0A021VT35_9CELL|nr:PH domain-containing protein [Actinotalea ferrariae]EYR64288.1 membrane protein [Actinotalea ferrariae CF5-4]
MVKPSMLATDEVVVFRAHAHWKRLVLPVLVALLTGAALWFLLVQVVPSPQDQAWQRWSLAAAAAVILLAFAVRPALVWAASTDTLTTQRLVSRRGVLTREGRDIPIDRVHSVSYRRTLLDRVLGCGTLVVRTAGDQSDVELDDVARIEKRLLQIQEIVLGQEIPAEGNPRRGTADGT